MPARRQSTALLWYTSPYASVYELVPLPDAEQGEYVPTMWLRRVAALGLLGADLAGCITAAEPSAPLSDALIITARKVGRCAFGQGKEFDRHFPISVCSGRWVLHMPRHVAVELPPPQLACAWRKVCDSRLAHPTNSLPSRNESHHVVINPRARPTAGRGLPWLRRFGQIIAVLLRPKAVCLCNSQEPVPHLRHRVFSRRCNPQPFQFREQPLAYARDKALVLQ
jgi:hypothetical protein